MKPARMQILIGVIEACLKKSESFILLVHSNIDGGTELINPTEIETEQVAAILEEAAKELRMEDNPEKN